MEYMTVLFRTFFFYAFITLIYRFMGKREIGQLGIVDLIVSILIAELAAVSIEQRDESIWLSIIPIFLLLVIQVGMSYISLKSDKIRSLFDGDPSVIVDHGKINVKEMIKQRYNMEDLLTQLREKHIRSLEEVDYAVLENSGKLSVFKKDTKLLGQYPLPVILDGKIDYAVLNHIGKNEEWIVKTLAKDQLALSDIFYASYHDKKLFLIRYDELEK